MFVTLNKQISSFLQFILTGYNTSHIKNIPNITISFTSYSFVLLLRNWISTVILLVWFGLDLILYLFVNSIKIFESMEDLCPCNGMIWPIFYKLFEDPSGWNEVHKYKIYLFRCFSIWSDLTFLSASQFHEVLFSFMSSADWIVKS